MTLKQFKIIALVLLLIPGTVSMLRHLVGTRGTVGVQREIVSLRSNPLIAADFSGVIHPWHRYEFTTSTPDWRSILRSRFQEIPLFDPVVSIAARMPLVAQIAGLDQRGKDEAAYRGALLSSTVVILALIAILALLIIGAIVLHSRQKSSGESRSRYPRTPQDHGYDFKNLGAE